MLISYKSSDKTRCVFAFSSLEVFADSSEEETETGTTQDAIDDDDLLLV